MANLVAIVYPDEYRAAEVMAALKRLQKEYLLDLEDACCVVRAKDSGKVTLHQAVNLTAAGAAGGALWGTIIGMLFLNPLLGLAAGAAAGALSGKLSDYGISDDFMKQLADTMPPGSSAIFMLVRRATLDKVQPEIAKFGGSLLYTNLSREAEANIQKLLEQGGPAGQQAAADQPAEPAPPSGPAPAAP